MKELYTSPKAELICFVPAQKLANGLDLNFGDFSGVQVGDGNVASATEGDIKLPNNV